MNHPGDMHHIPSGTKPDDLHSFVGPAPVGSARAQSNISLSDLAAVFWCLFLLAVFIVSATDTHYIVTIQSQPTDCDFWSAPIGTKPCHYERRVLPDNDRSPPGHLNVFVKVTE